MIVIETASEATDEVVEAIGRLLPLLSRSAPPPTAEQVTEMVRSPATTVLLARDDATGSIVGTLTLVMFRIPSAVRAIIEDVIVSEDARGQGCGELLTREAIAVAGTAGVKTVDLTSRPSREAANRLYLRVGFFKRETNVYRYTLGSDDD